MNMKTFETEDVETISLVEEQQIKFSFRARG
jgi:hypothetical protein